MTNRPFFLTTGVVSGTGTVGVVLGGAGAGLLVADEGVLLLLAAFENSGLIPGSGGGGGAPSVGIDCAAVVVVAPVVITGPVVTVTSGVIAVAGTCWIILKRPFFLVTTLVPGGIWTLVPGCIWTTEVDPTIPTFETAAEDDMVVCGVDGAAATDASGVGWV